jgi:hypothetical protein
LSADISSNARASNIFFGLAGAAAITGTVLLILGDKKESSSRRGMRIVPTPGGAALLACF